MDYSTQGQSVGVATPTSLCMPFPIRSGFTAQVVIPRDMTKAESERLCAFIMALAVSTSSEVRHD